MHITTGVHFIISPREWIECMGYSGPRHDPRWRGS